MLGDQVPDDEHGPRDGATATVRPGEFSALLLDLARAPEASLGSAWETVHRGATVGRFELVREIGRGGFGVVWEARDSSLGRAVALKLVRPGDLERVREERMLREAEAAAQLAHPNIVTLFDVGRSEHGPYLVYELLRGQTLHERIAAGPLPLREAVRIATEIASGMAYAHERGVVHRDLKPANVFLSDDGRVRILDLGLAHAFGRRRQDGGTPAYMAPEQWRGAPEDERTDVFALGVVLYRMLSGTMPFPDSGRKGRTPPRPAPSLDVGPVPAIGTLVARMLDADPVKRPRDGGEVFRALVPLAAALERTPAAGVTSIVRRRSLSRRAALAGAALLSISLALCAVLVLVRGDPDGAPSVAVASAASGTRSLEAYQRHLRAMDLRMRDCDFAAAEQEERRALALDPEFGAAHLQLGLILQYTRESMEDAHAHLRAASALVDGMPDRERRIIEADKHVTPSMWPDGDDGGAHKAAALTAVGKLVERYPDDTYVLFFAGWAEGVHGHWDRAIAYGQRSLEIDPGQCYVLGWTSGALFRTGRAPESVDLARRAVAARPNAANLAMLAMVLARTGALEEAAHRARESLRARNGGRQDSTLHAIVSLASSGYPDEAEAAAEDLGRSEVEALRRQAKRYHTLAVALQGRVREAIALWPEEDVAISAAPLDARAVLLGTGQPRLAAHESLRRLRESHVAALRAGELAFHGDLAGATRAAEALEAHSAPHAYYRAVGLAQERRWREAIPALQALLMNWGEREIGRPDPRPSYQMQVRLLLAEGLFTTGRPADALEALRSADQFGAIDLSAVENLPRMWLLRAEALEQMNKPIEAAQVIGRLLHQWRGADPDLALLADARAIHQRLAENGAGSLRFARDPAPAGR